MVNIIQNQLQMGYEAFTDMTVNICNRFVIFCKRFRNFSKENRQISCVFHQLFIVLHSDKR